MTDTTGDWKPVPAEANFACRVCGSHTIEFRKWESSDGGHEDLNYHCLGCGRYWWVEGPDY